MRAFAIFAVPVVASFLACGARDSTNATDTSPTNAIPINIPQGSTGGPTPAGTATASLNGSSSSGNTSTSSDDGDPPAPPPTEITLTTQTMQFNGQTRSYILGVPNNYDASHAYPLVMLFHGNPGTKEEMRSVAPFEQVSHQDAVLVYPDALQGAWDLYTPTATNLDMSWILALPAALAQTENIDQAHVYGFGFSGGSFMMAQMGCRFGGFFRAIAINSGGGPQEGQSGDAMRSDGCYLCPGGPIPTIIVHGDADTTVDPSSGQFTAHCFAETNNCAATPTGVPEDPTAPSPCAKGDGCTKPETWCFIPGMNHQLWEQAMGAGWAFFQAAP